MTETNHFLVLGLGSLGQHCVLALKEFGVRVVGIEAQAPTEWELPEVRLLLDELVLGDMCQDQTLHQAQIAHCRAALLVTSNERINAEAAIAIRQLNPRTRLVVRSSKENLNRLLSDQLGNFCAFDPTSLPALTFAIAALGTETLGFFNLDGHWLRVVRRQIHAHDPWRDRLPLHEIDSRQRRLLTYTPTDQLAPVSPLGDWSADQRLQTGDTVIYLETAESFFLAQQQQQLSRFAQLRQARLPLLRWSQVKQWGQRFFQMSFQQQFRRVAIFSGLIVLLLLGLGTMLLSSYLPGISGLQAFYMTAILLLGGYGDLFGDVEAALTLPWWLQLFALSLTLAGTAFVGILYALLTESLLRAQFQFNRQRPQVPNQYHTLLVGLGRVGQRTALWLEEFKQAVVGIALNDKTPPTLLPHLPLITGNLRQSLEDANVRTAKSVIVATDDEMLNLEVALTTRSLNPAAHLAIRTSGQRLSNHLTHLFPEAQILCTYAVMAEAFAGAAFGENILSLFRIHNQTILVTEYQIEAVDTLHNSLISDIAQGYGVIPILHQRPHQPAQLMPSEDQLVKPGDRLVILATIEGLQWVEQGQKHPKHCHIHLEATTSESARFEGAQIIARTTGCSLQTANDLMQNLPQRLPLPLYPRQGQRLQRMLNRARLRASIHFGENV